MATGASYCTSRLFDQGLNVVSTGLDFLLGLSKKYGFSSSTRFHRKSGFSGRWTKNGAVRGKTYPYKFPFFFDSRKRRQLRPVNFYCTGGLSGAFSFTSSIVTSNIRWSNGLIFGERGSAP